MGKQGIRSGGKGEPGRVGLRGGRAPKQATPRKNDWSEAMAERFVEALAETCNVTLAARAIERSMSNVYKRRARDATFRASWDQALTIGYSRLEMMLLERALHGVEKVVVAKDGTSSVMRDYPDRVALALLRMHRDSVAKTEQTVDEQAVVEARDRILARIERLRARAGVRFGARVERKGMIQLEAILRVANWAGRAGRKGPKDGAGESV